MTTYLDKIELADALASKSQLTEADAEETGEKTKAGIARRHGLVGFGKIERWHKRASSTNGSPTTARQASVARPI